MSSIEVGNKRRRTNDDNQAETTDAQDGATEVGFGLQVTMPKSIPHLYNNNYTVRLTYADTFVKQVECFSNAATQFATFRTNSIYDPDYAIGGHQPLCRDNWAGMYDYYAVLACHYTLRVWNGAAGAVTYTAVGSNLQNLSAVSLTVLPTTRATDLVNSGVLYPTAEQKNAKTYMITPGADPLTIKGTLTPGDFVVDAIDQDSDNTWTAVGANPGVDRLLSFVFNGVNQTSFAGLNMNPFAAISCQIILDYDVQFTQVNPTVRQSPS